MSYKRKIFKLTFFTLLLFSVFYIFNFVTDKKDALANINNKQIVEVFKTPSCGCCYGYVLFLEEEKFKVKQTDMRSLHTCLLYTSPSPRDRIRSRMPSSA